MKFYRFLIAALATVAFVACGPDTNDDDDDTPVPEGTTFTIEVDKTTIEADGVDAATFIVRDAQGNDVLLDEATLGKTYFVNAENEKRLPRSSKSFSSIKNGTYTFYATVRGKKTENTVTITVQNRQNYEKYRHQVCVFQFTGTWCPNCPRMTEGLSKLKAGDYGDNVIVLASHLNDEYSIKSEGKDVATEICNKFGITGIPYCVYDLAFSNGQSSESMLNSLIEQQLMVAPAKCGVKIGKTSMDASGNVSIEASVTATKAGDYDVAFVVLADNMPGSSKSVEPVYHHVVTAVSPNYAKMSDNTKVHLEAGQEYTTTFTTKIDKPFGDINVVANDCRVVVYVHDGQQIDNANVCAMGSSVDYILN